MELYDHIRKISFIFFICIGLVHFLAGLLYINGYLPNQSAVINRVFFIPFVVVSLTYCFTNILFNLSEKGPVKKSIHYTFVIIGIIIFLGLLAAELLLPDSPSPLNAISL